MTSLNQLLHTASDALKAQSFGLSVTGQNIANASTPGYVRREALLSTRALADQTTGSVQVDGLRRATDSYVEARFLASNGLAAAAQEHQTQLSSLEALFNDGAGAGLGSSLDQLFGSFTALSANPSDPTTRANVLERAREFAERASSLGDSLATTRDELLSRAQASVAEINARASEVAELNRKIAAADALGHDAADLRDQRDKVLLNLSSLVDLHVFADSNGGLVVQSSGTTLVEGNVARKLVLDLAPGGDLRLQAETTGGSLTDITRYLTGGQLHGIREARDVDVFELTQRLDQLVFDVASAINTQHAAGFGLDGVNGRGLFQLSGPTGAARSIALDPDMLGQPERVAAALSALSLPGSADNAVLLAAIAAQALAGSGGTRTPSEAYADLVGDVATRKARASGAAEMRANIFSQTQAMKESLSGVSLDEEMVALTKYQRAYQASARVLTTVDELLQDLLSRI